MAVPLFRTSSICLLLVVLSACGPTVGTSCSQGAQDVVPPVGMLGFVKDVFWVDGPTLRQALSAGSPDADGHVSVQLDVARPADATSARSVVEEVLVPVDIAASISQDGAEPEYLLGVAYSSRSESWQVEVGLAGDASEYRWLGRCSSDLSEITSALQTSPEYAADARGAYVRLLVDPTFRDGVVAQVGEAQQEPAVPTFLDPLRVKSDG